VKIINLPKIWANVQSIGDHALTGEDSGDRRKEVVMGRLRVMVKSLPHFQVLAMAAVVGLLGWGCAAYGSMGHLHPDRAVKRMFESGTVSEEYNYYYSGADARPRAIIGIQKDYQLVSKLWKPVNLTQEQLSDWINWRGPRLGYDQSRNGSKILDDQGNPIGIWYANRDWRDYTTIKMLGDHRVSVTTPLQYNIDNMHDLNRNFKMH